MELGEDEALDGIIAAARVIERTKADKSEPQKQAKDRARAELAIAALDRFIINPDGVRFRSVASEPPVPMELVIAAGEERDRLVSQLDNPEALRLIYRRNEVRR